ncbi:hypothetical protein BH23CHL8_BH23CHL8_22480 [soil metagenome]
MAPSLAGTCGRLYTHKPDPVQRRPSSPAWAPMVRGGAVGCPVPVPGGSARPGAPRMASDRAVHWPVGVPGASAVLPATATAPDRAVHWPVGVHLPSGSGPDMGDTSWPMAAKSRWPDSPQDDTTPPAQDPARAPRRGCAEEDQAHPGRGHPDRSGGRRSERPSAREDGGREPDNGARPGGGYRRAHAAGRDPLVRGARHVDERAAVPGQRPARPRSSPARHDRGTPADPASTLARTAGGACLPTRPGCHRPRPR